MGEEAVGDPEGRCGETPDYSGAGAARKEGDYTEEETLRYRARRKEMRAVTQRVVLSPT